MKMRFLLSLTLSIILSMNTLVFAHPGRTDSSGGHYVRKSGWGYPVGSYHYHNGGGSSSSGSTNKNSSKTSSSTVMQVQKKLNSLGYNCGTPDGLMGTKTKNALKKFQADNKLTSDGVIGSNTLKKLGLS